jgi:WD40 repeat protein
MEGFDDSVTGGAVIVDISFSPNGTILGLCFGQTLLLLAAQDGQIIHRLDLDYEISGIAFTPDNHQLAAACSDSRVRLFDVTSAQEVRSMYSELGGYHTVTWSPDGQLLAAGHYEPWVDVFEAGTGRQLHALDPNIFDDEGRTCVLFVNDGTLLVSTAYNSIVVWSLPKEIGKSKRASRKKLSIRGHAHIIDIAFSPDGTLIAGLADAEGVSTLYFWQFEARTNLGQIKLPHTAQRLAWSRDAAWIAVAETNGDGISLWDPSTRGRARLALEESEEHDVSALAVHPNGEVVVAGTDTGRVVSWNTVTGHKL